MKLVTLKSSGTLGSGGKPALDALKKAFEQTQLDSASFIWRVLDVTEV